MINLNWPISMLEGCEVPDDVLLFLNQYAETEFKQSKILEELYEEHDLLKETSAKQDRYIVELEKQLDLLQKTLDLAYRNMNGVREDG